MKTAFLVVFDHPEKIAASFLSHVLRLPGIPKNTVTPLPAHVLALCQNALNPSAQDAIVTAERPSGQGGGPAPGQPPSA